MNNKIIIINGPNLNLLGEREQSQYGSITFDKLRENCKKKCEELNLEMKFTQSNIEGEIVNIIQSSIKEFDGITPVIRGWAKIYGYNKIIVDDDDPFYSGFQVI